MLAPIITKDMKLFPSQPLPAKIKNVRYRAQSLDDLKRTAAGRSLTIPVRQRSSQSVGHLPMASRSPPKPTGLVRKPVTLDAIVEGVEMSSCNGVSKASGDVIATASVTSSAASSPEFQILSRRGSEGSTSSAPPCEKTTLNGAKTIVKWITGALKSKTKNGNEGDSENGKLRKMAVCS